MRIDVSPIRTILAEPQAGIRERLLDWLRREPDVEVVGEAHNGHGAVGLIKATAPHLAFVNVELPGLDGFGVLAALRSRVPPAVIFVATGPVGAVRAFSERAVDYLLQPFDESRLRRSLERARQRLGRVSRLTQRPPGDRRPSARHIAVKSGDRIRMLRLEDFVWIEAVGRRSTVHLREGSLEAEVSLGAFERRLPAGAFVRINRFAMVRQSRVLETRPKSHGDHWLMLDTGERMVLSRGRRREALRRLGYPK